MPARLIFHPAVADDIRAACTYYEGKVPGLGERFKAAFYTRVEQLAAMPLACPVRFDDVRTAQLKRFPYLVFTAVEEDTVLILTVQYAGRDPAWFREVVGKRR